MHVHGVATVGTFVAFLINCKVLNCKKNAIPSSLFSFDHSYNYVMGILHVLK